MTNFRSGALPALRNAIDLIPIQSDGKRLIVLRDRLEPSAEPVAVNQGAVELLRLLDGRRTLHELLSAYRRSTGHPLGELEVAQFLESLDRANLLDSPSFRRRAETSRKAFLSLDERPAIHAGGAYPGTEAELVPFLDRLYGATDGPGRRPAAADGRFARGLIAPHIDLHRGGPTYAWTYGALAEREPADLYVLLGTCHTPMKRPLAATRKAYGTPLGPAPTDDRFLDLLEQHGPDDLYDDELSHRAEHSLEFQALYLRYLGLVGREGRASIVPILCGSLHEWVEPGREPDAVPEISQSVERLRRALAGDGRRICLIAGADLAHVGPQFGDPGSVSRQVQETVERDDRAMLELICSLDAAGFYRQVMADRDARKICGLAPIYYLLTLLEGCSGRVLKYSQWVDAGEQGSVTYAGVIFDQD